LPRIARVEASRKFSSNGVVLDAKAPWPSRGKSFLGGDDAIVVGFPDARVNADASPIP
jgi:hypothetical protein